MSQKLFLVAVGVAGLGWAWTTGRLDGIDGLPPPQAVFGDYERQKAPGAKAADVIHQGARKSLGE